MIKRDRIFYVACGLSAVGLILVIMGFEISLLLFVAAYLLRPALREFGLASRFADERQQEIYSRSGHFAYIIVMLVLVGLILWRIAQSEPNGDMLTLLGIGIAARSLTTVIMAGEYRKAGVLIISGAGLFFALFIAAVEGPSVASIGGGVLGLIIIGFGQVARKFPKTIAVILVFFAALVIAVFNLFDFRHASIAMWMFFVIPVLTAALCLFLGGIGAEENITNRTRNIAFGSLGGGAAIVFILIVIFGSGVEKTHGYTAAVPQGEMEEVQGVACSGAVEYYKNGKLEFCRLAREDTLSGQPLPAGTGVHFTEDGIFNWCFLPENMEIQGIMCRGYGHDFSTAFYPNGQLKTAWLTEDQEIQGIPCARFRFFSAIFAVFTGKYGGTQFYDNGQLRFCELSKNITIQGQEFRKGELVRFDKDGNLSMETK